MKPIRLNSRLAIRRIHAKWAWAGGITGGVLALLALAQVLDNDVSAATLTSQDIGAPDAIVVPADVVPHDAARAPSTEIAQAMPF